MSERMGGARGAALWGGALLLAAAAVRIAACRGDLWQDEIWSLYFAERASSSLGVLLEFRHDNNHLANTLYLRWVGERTAFVYRLPALLAGIGAVAAAWAVARRWGRAEALAALLLTGSSALLIQYAGEARGYAPAVLFLLLCILAVERGRRDGRGRWPALFNACALLGALFHLSFATAYGALLGWWLWTWRGALRPAEVARWHALPLAALLLLYVGFVRGMELGGGGRDPAPVAQVLLEAAALSVGVAPRGVAAWLGAAAFAGLLALGLRHSLRSGSGRAVLYATGIVVCPALALLLQAPEYTAPRYYLLGATLFLLLLAELCGAALRRGGPRRVAAAALLAAFAMLNAGLVSPLLRHGRGRYVDALQWIARHTRGDAIHLGSDHAFRNRWIVDYYAPRLDLGKPLRFYRKREWPEAGPEWYVGHRLGWDPVAPDVAEDHRGARYRLAARFPSGPLSGMHWFVYRRVSAP